MTDLSLFRVYEPEECGSDGYPRVWHDARGLAETLAVGKYGVKDLVRMAAGDRCERCQHPYTKRESAVWAEEPVPEWAKGRRIIDQGSLFEGLEELAEVAGWMPGEEVPDPVRTLYSACDDRCTHGGPIRWRSAMTGEWHQRLDDLSVHDVEFALKEVSAVQAAWRILTVHHLLSEPDQKRDLRWWNLASLCQRCHLTIQRKVKMERVFPYEHTPWFRPHAAGWYAAVYLGEDLTREATMERLDELLALERVG